MSITIEAQATRTLIQQDGVSRVAFNDDGSMEILTPTSNPTGNLVPTSGQLLGMGQTWQDVTGSRVIGTSYNNSTGRPIEVSVTISQGSSGNGSLIVSGVTVASFYNATSSNTGTVTAVIPAGATYSYSLTAGTQTILRWSELR